MPEVQILLVTFKDIYDKETINVEVVAEAHLCDNAFGDRDTSGNEDSRLVKAHGSVSGHPALRNRKGEVRNCET